MIDQAMIASFVRVILALAVGYFGIEIAQDKLGELVSAVSLVVFVVGSLAWSKWDDNKKVKKSLEQTKPE
jgi:hypothetical protein